MSSDKGIIDREINGQVFYQVPALGISFAAQTIDVTERISILLEGVGEGLPEFTPADAARFLVSLINRAPRIGIQLFLYIEELDTLPSSLRDIASTHLLRRGNVYFSAPVSVSDVHRQ